MTDLDDFRELAVELIAEFGTTGVVQVVTATMADDGSVNETIVAHSVSCTDIVDESRRYESQATAQRVTGTVYLADRGLTFTPAIGQRFVYQSRTFPVTAVFPYRAQGGTALWRLDLAEAPDA